MKANGTQLAPSNGDSVDLVTRGEFAFGLVDSYDVVNRARQHDKRLKPAVQAGYLTTINGD
jgi:hypothetical protein